MHARQLGKVVAEQLVEMIDRAREYLEHIVAVAGGRVAFDDGGVRHHRGLEIGMGLEADPDLDEALHRETEGARAEARGIAANDARPFESAASRPAGRFGKAECPAQSGEGAASTLFRR